MSTLTIRDDGLLDVGGALLPALVRASSVTGGGASLDAQKRQGATGASLVFDGWEDRQIRLELQIQETDPAATQRYRHLETLQAAALARRADGALQVWAFGGQLARALKLSNVIFLRQPEVDDDAGGDDLIVTLALREFDPEADKISLPAAVAPLSVGATTPAAPPSGSAPGAATVPPAPSGDSAAGAATAPTRPPGDSAAGASVAGLDLDGWLNEAEHRLRGVDTPLSGASED